MSTFPACRTILGLAFACIACITFLAERAEAAVTDRLATVKSRADLDALIGATPDAAAKESLQKHAAEILAAAARKPHLDAVVRTLDEARGTYERINLTPEGLQAALGGPSALFDGLKTVSLADAGLGVKAKRETDPFDQAFYEHLPHIAGLEGVVIMHTTCQNAWLAPLATIKTLRQLRIINQAKLNDEGLALLAPLNQLETFSFIGTAMTGAPFKNFGVWPNCKQSSYRGSRMSDEGLIALCAAFPNLESISLAHGHFSDAAVAHAAKLKNLKGLEIGSRLATPECLKSLVGLKLEYLQLGDGLDASAGIAILPQIATLKRLTLTQCQATTDDDLAKVAGMKHLESLELGNLPLPAERVATLKPFAFLKTLRITNPRNPFDDQTKAAVQAALPGVTIAFQ